MTSGRPGWKKGELDIRVREEKEIICKVSISKIKKAKKGRNGKQKA